MTIIRLLSIDDLSSELFTEGVYPRQLDETRDCIECRLERFPLGCLAAADADSGKLMGYSLGNPWRIDLGAMPLNVMLEVPRRPDCYYIHDLAVLPKYRKKCVGTHLFNMQNGMAHVHQVDQIRLVAVLDSEAFWMRFGFHEVHKLPYAYGISGTFMLKYL